jgi:hypothetical protein
LILAAARGDFSATMAWKRKITGGTLAVIGFMLSPLSWWNDLFVNVPLALVFAWVISFFHQPAFKASVIVGYWLTNVLGFVLMHKGAQSLLSDEERKYSRRALFKDVGISLLYTALILLLLKLGILKPLKNYFPSASGG